MNSGWRERKKGCWRSDEVGLKRLWESVCPRRCFALNLRNQTLCVCLRRAEEEEEGLGVQV